MAQTRATFFLFASLWSDFVSFSRFGTTAESPAGLAAQQVLQLTSKDLNWRMSDTLSPLRCPRLGTQGRRCPLLIIVSTY